MLYLKPDDEKDASLFRDTETNVELEVVERVPLVEWFANNYKSFGASLEFVTDKSQEGSQFVKGFGGVGGACYTRPFHASAAPHVPRRSSAACCPLVVAGRRQCTLQSLTLGCDAMLCGVQVSCGGRSTLWSWRSTRTTTTGGKSAAAKSPLRDAWCSG